MDSVKEFLEASTIHGLVYISASKKKLQKILWVSVVFTGFLFAGILIKTSFSDWAKNPFSTTMETFQINDVSFPR